MRSTTTAAVRHMLLGTFFFALMNVCIKQLSGIPPMQIVFFRCLVSLVLCIAALRQSLHLLRGNNRSLLFLRGLFGTAALYFFFITLSKMPLATAVTLQYTSPIFTTLLAVVMNSEKVKPVQWACFMLSFSGILLLNGFELGSSVWYYAAGLFSAFCSGVAYNLVRNLRESEHPMVVVLHFQLVGTAIGGACTAVSFVMPQHAEWILLLLIGLFTHYGQVNLTHALQAEKLGLISSLNYLGIVYAILFGLLFFNEQLDARTLIAIAVVVSGVLLNFYFGKKSVPQSAAT